MLKELVFKLIPKWRFMNTYSQAGEDVIAAYFFSARGIQKPTYLDIGTNDPIYGNNTFLFYKRGSRGVCIEADPSLAPAISAARPQDTCLNAGVTFDNRSEAEFFVFEEKAHNTLSREEAEYRQKVSRFKLLETIRIPLININTLIEKHFSKAPDFMSLDVEGVDLDILKTLDFNRFRPALICVETITFSLDNTEEKIDEISTFMKSKNYVVFADTHINTLYADAAVLRKKAS